MLLIRRRRWKGGAVALLVALAAVSCGRASDAPPSPGTAPDGRSIDGELSIFAASSLTDAFKSLAEAFGEAHPRVSVIFNFASSSSLAVQIDEGAPADVFASAGEPQMDAVTAAGNASNPQVFATNDLVIVVPAGSSRVTSLADLAQPGLRLVLAGPDVPAGVYARQALANAAQAQGGPGAGFAAEVLSNVRSNESNVRAVLTKVQLGEADAGIVYGTDAMLVEDEVDVVEIPPAYNVAALYPIAQTTRSRNPSAAAAWVAYVLSPEGQSILARFGFGPPP